MIEEIINDIGLEEVWKNICEQRDDPIIWDLWWAINFTIWEIQSQTAGVMLRASDLI